MTLATISCKKESKEAFAPAAQKFKVSMSTTSSDNTKKAAAISKEIKAGDTVTLYDFRGYLVFSAEYENGEKVSGSWLIDLNDSDDSYMRVDGKSAYSENSLAQYKVQYLGLFKAVFTPRIGDDFPFFIKNIGIPGNLGDAPGNNSFRFDKGLFYKNSAVQYQSGFTMYIKSDENDFAKGAGVFDLSDETKYFALIYTDSPKDSVPTAHYTWMGTQRIQLKKCKYSTNYYYCTFLTNETVPNGNGDYRVGFYFGLINENWWFFDAENHSDLKEYGLIKFHSF